MRAEADHHDHDHKHGGTAINYLTVYLNDCAGALHVHDIIDNSVSLHNDVRRAALERVRAAIDAELGAGSKRPALNSAACAGLDAIATVVAELPSVGAISRDELTRALRAARHRAEQR